jgi:hypothetical protein
MATIDQDLVDLLEASAGVTAIVGSGSAARIYPLLVPQGFENYPAITYQVISENREPELTQQNGLFQARVQLNCWARTYAGARALKEAVRNCIDGSSSTFTSGAFLENGIDSVEESEGSRPGRLFAKRLDVLVWVKEDYPTFA